MKAFFAAGHFVAQVADSHGQPGGWPLADILALVALVLAVVALIFAAKQYVDAKHQTTKLVEATSQLAAHTTRLEDIRGSLSTQYLGVFPDFIPRIVETLERAQKSIIIFCDYPAYGRFSAPDQWLEYKYVIERKVQAGLEVSLTCMNAERRRQYHKDQFQRVEKNWKDFLSKSPNRGHLEQLFQHHRDDLGGQVKGVDELSFDDFEKLMAAANQWMLDEVFATAKTPPVELSTDMPLYFWLADGLRAVFAIPSLSDDATEYGFITGEAKLITAFQNMRARYLHRATK